MNIDHISELSQYWRAIIIHNIINMPTQGLQVLCPDSDPRQTVHYYLHDYYPLCKQINLLKNDRYFCDAPRMNWQPCSDCQYYSGQQQTYAFHQQFFSDQRVLLAAPSSFVRNYYLSAFPTLSPERICVFPHLRYSLITSAKQSFKGRVAFCGSQAWHKGWPDFVDLVSVHDKNHNRLI